MPSTGREQQRSTCLALQVTPEYQISLVCMIRSHGNAMVITLFTVITKSTEVTKFRLRTWTSGVENFHIAVNAHRVLLYVY